MVLVLRAQPYARSIVQPQPPARLLPLRNLQPFATPDALYSVLACLPAFSLQQRRDPSIAVTSILAGQLHDGPAECIFFFALRQVIALRAAWLVYQPARPTL